MVGVDIVVECGNIVEFDMVDWLVSVVIVIGFLLCGVLYLVVVVEDVMLINIIDEFIDCDWLFKVFGFWNLYCVIFG